jgi:hypothetical protein
MSSFAIFLCCFLSDFVFVASVDPSSVCYYGPSGQVKYSSSVTYREIFIEKIDLALMKSG